MRTSLDDLVLSKSRPSPCPSIINTSPCIHQPLVLAELLQTPPRSMFGSIKSHGTCKYLWQDLTCCMHMSFRPVCRFCSLGPKAPCYLETRCEAQAQWRKLFS
ncbi:hypothetical protein KIL84_004489 [Mauremys mutica]|uniref:Uncharacterized protein n=1 Tax=Mauremys mutica TaxID=74926 RepID=A0A9D4B028_9SAUR|nr:hypothetical protein KIL84_004489 [Mauremys mutica]